MSAHESRRLYYAYARHALVTALRLVRVESDSRVLLPEFICRDVLASLRAIGAEAVFYEVDDELQPRSSISLMHALDAVAQPPAAIIAVNFFGFPADLARVRQLVPSRQVPVIEDNAHGWLSADQSGTPLGSRTEAGITSVRKTIRVPDGAYVEWRNDVTLNTRALHEPLTPRAEALPVSFRVRRAMSQIDARAPMAVMPLARDAVRLLRRLGGKPSVSDNAAEEWNLPANRSPHRESLKFMSQLDNAREIARRRTLFERAVTSWQRNLVSSGRSSRFHDTFLRRASPTSATLIARCRSPEPCAVIDLVRTSLDLRCQATLHSLQTLDFVPCTS